MSGALSFNRYLLLAFIGRVLSVFLVFCAVSCRAASSLPQVDTEIFSQDGLLLGSFRVEVAANNDERSKGLMFRRELAANRGMLFLFPSERRLSFWMRNTVIPLDMVFISSEWRVVGIVEKAVPLSEETRGVEANSQYVLEFAGGTAARLGITSGSKVVVKGVLPASS